MESPAQLFRNELSQRLCTDTNFSLPNVNLLVGVLMDAMEYNLCARYRPLAHTTLQNVLRVSKEIECLGRMLRLNIRVRHESIHALHPFTLQALYMLSIPATSLLNPCPEVISLMTYVAVVHRLSSYIGARAVYDLVRDFNRTIPRKFDPGVVNKVPGVGPRITGRHEMGDGFEPVKLECAGKLGISPHLVRFTSPRRYGGRHTRLRVDFPSAPFQLPELHAHIPRHIHSRELSGRRIPPSPHAQLLWLNSPPHSYTTTLDFHQFQSSCPRREQALIMTPVLIPTFVRAPTVDSSVLLENPRRSSPDPYRILEELDSNGLND